MVAAGSAFTGMVDIKPSSVRTSATRTSKFPPPSATQRFLMRCMLLSQHGHNSTCTKPCQTRTMPRAKRKTNKIARTYNNDDDVMAVCMLGEYGIFGKNFRLNFHHSDQKHSATIRNVWPKSMKCPPSLRFYMRGFPAAAM